jgi:hypothetical protein
MSTSNIARILVVICAAGICSSALAQGQLVRRPGLDEPGQSLSSAGLQFIAVGACEVVAQAGRQEPLVRKKNPDERHVFAIGESCPKTLATSQGPARVVTLSDYLVSNYAFIGFRKNGTSVKIVRNYSAKRGASGIKGFRYIFYPVRRS